MYAITSKTMDNEVYAPEIAIVAFWRQNEYKEFKCYRHFTIPNPMKREIRRSNRGSENTLAQFLYQGNQNEIFFFHKETVIDEETKINSLLENEAIKKEKEQT